MILPPCKSMILGRITSVPFSHIDSHERNVHFHKMKTYDQG